MVTESKLNMSEIARRSGCHLTHISRILSGDRTPSLPMARKIADAMGISLDRLWSMLEEVKN